MTNTVNVIKDDLEFLFKTINGATCLNPVDGIPKDLDATAYLTGSYKKEQELSNKLKELAKKYNVNIYTRTSSANSNPKSGTKTEPVTTARETTKISK